MLEKLAYGVILGAMVILVYVMFNCVINFDCFSNLIKAL
jgi:hypothetical protein